MRALILTLAAVVAFHPLFLRAETDEGPAALGILSNPMTQAKAKKLGFDNPFGSYVAYVVPNSAAHQAGIQALDYIFQIDNRQTTASKSLTDLLENYEPGEEVTVHLVRLGQKQEIRVVLSDRDQLEFTTEKEDSERAFLGISPTDASADEGIEISVKSGSSADKMGLRSGDVLSRINGLPVIDWDDVTAIMRSATPGQTLEVDFVRDGKKEKTSGLVGSLAEYSEQPEEQTEPVFLGIYLEKISEEKAAKLGFDNPYGAYISGIVPNTAAAKAGLQPFDYLYGIDEFRVGEEQPLGYILKKFKPGDQASLYIVRQGNKTTLPITMGKKFEYEKVVKDDCQRAFFGVMENYRTEVEELSGVPVDVVDNSSAQAIGLQNGDIIVAINNNRIVDWMDISIAIDNMAPGQAIKVAYLRNGQKGTVSGKIKSYSETKNCPNCNCNEDDADWNIDFDFPPMAPPAPSAPDRPAGNMNATVQDMTQQEAQSLKDKYGLDIPPSNAVILQNLTVSPNPSNGLFSLGFDLIQPGNTVIRIYNANGRAIYENDLGNFMGNFSDAVDISQNGPGTYYLEIRQDANTLSRKIILSNK